MNRIALTTAAQRLRLPPAWRARWTQLRDEAGRHWRQLSAREQTLLAALAAIAVLALLVQLAVRPAWRDIDTAATELPRLRAQAAAVDAVIQETLALQGAVRGRIPPEAMAGELEASLASVGVDGTHSVTPVSGSREPAWDLVFEQAPAAALFNWLSTMPGQLRLSVQSAAVGRAMDAAGKPVPARVSGSLRLVASEEAQ